MPHITREDGQSFVIPSYRDVLAVKQKSALKKEILLLSQSYGEYITLQRKGTNQYEVAFSTEAGYLLGESVWYYFKRPFDFIYCEALPNSNEAILVIVKAGSVYLDGSFPIESIPEELVIFLTQQNNFEIYTYGDVPISQTSQEGKFSFDPSSIKSFTVLDKPAFATLPLVKAYQLQLVEQVLKSHGIGVFPIKPLLLVLAVVGLGWGLYSFIVKQQRMAIVGIPVANPYQGYVDTLLSPAPEQIINEFLENVYSFATIPGWRLTAVNYEKPQIIAKMISTGSKIEALQAWANQHNVQLDIRSDGIYLVTVVSLNLRPMPTKIYSVKAVIARLVDNVVSVYPGNRITLGASVVKGPFTEIPITINLTSVTPMVLTLVAEQLADLPFSLEKITMTYDTGSLSGSINLNALGS